jgi:hypothetical protein
MVCNGDNLHYCGGGNGLNVYQYGGTGGTTPPPTTTTTSTAPTTSATGPTHLQAYGNWQFQGCWR